MSKARDNRRRRKRAKARTENRAYFGNRTCKYWKKMDVPKSHRRAVAAMAKRISDDIGEMILDSLFSNAGKLRPHTRRIR
jgi:hypothetical protein